MQLAITKNKNYVNVSTKDDVIEIWAGDISIDRSDFAIWLFLPVAMRLGVDIYIDGIGSRTTINNARKLSEIWEQWLPSHFSAVSCEFTEIIEDEDASLDVADKCLHFYSGGVDSAYSLLERFNLGLTQSLITVHGMDYKSHNDEKFEKLVQKTKAFSNMVGGERYLVKTNAAEVYGKHKVNAKGHVGVTFILGGVGSLYGNRYSTHVLAADFRIDQQFLAHPYGSNFVTNDLFNDGRSRLITSSQNIIRSEKLPLLLSSEIALNSLTFCTDKKNRPENCGVCQKCIRTKIMFLARTGKIPGLFLDDKMPINWVEVFDLSKLIQRAFFVEILMTAKKYNRLEVIPGGVRQFHKLKEGKPEGFFQKLKAKTWIR